MGELLGSARRTLEALRAETVQSMHGLDDTRDRNPFNRGEHGMVTQGGKSHSFVRVPRDKLPDKGLVRGHVFFIADAHPYTSSARERHSEAVLISGYFENRLRARLARAGKSVLHAFARAAPSYDIYHSLDLAPVDTEPISC